MIIEPATRTAPILPATVLIVDDVSANVGALSAALESAGYRVLAALSGSAALKTARKAQPDLILLDVLMPDVDGIETCRRLKAEPMTSGIPVMFITANDETQSLVDGFGAGGVDYITKPFQVDEVLTRVATHLKLSFLTRQLREKTIELQAANETLQAESNRRRAAEQALEIADRKLTLLSEAEAERWGLGGGFVGKGELFGRLLQQIRSVQAFARTNVLLTGESGTGKELIARAIHFGGAQGRGPFVAVNCSALPVELAESHFFGHVRGAFTGAVSDRKGYFELADGGTLFLDEIGDMPLLLQAKLLRVLEDGQVAPVGAVRSRPVSVRVIAATHVDLPARVAAGAFRQDLYYRLMHFHVAVPALRERREDIPALTAHFLERFAAEVGRPRLAIHADALAALMAYDYPGNIRELKNTLERAVIHARGEVIQPNHLTFVPAMARTPGPAPLAAHERPAEATPSFRLDDAQDRAIERALSASGGNLSAAARILGVNRARLQRWQSRRRAGGADGTSG